MSEPENDIFTKVTAQLREKTEENEKTQTLRNLAEAWWVAHRAFEDSGGIDNAVADTHAQEALIKELTDSWLPFIVPEFAAELAAARADIARLLECCGDMELKREIRARLEKP